VQPYRTFEANLFHTFGLLAWELVEPTLVLSPIIYPAHLVFWGVFSFFYLNFLAVASFYLHFLSSFTYLNDSLAIPRTLSRHLRFPSDYPIAPSPASIARYIHLGFVFWYREISICCAGIGYSASS
jgi:hypothetical protein